MVETEVPHHSASTDTKVTPQLDKESPATSDMEVTPPTTCDLEVTPSIDTEVTGPTSTESCIHINGGLFGGPSDISLLTGYVDHMGLKL